MLIHRATHLTRGDTFMLTLRKTHLNIGILILFSLATLVMQACSGETTGDTTAREIDREREAAQQVTDTYSPVIGDYRGETKTKSAQVLLHLEMDDVSQQGTEVPQPTLSGRLVIIPRALSGSPSHSTKITYVISAGEYDPGKQKLSFQVQQNATTTNVECNVQNNSQMNCDWYLVNESEFSVSKVMPTVGSSGSLTSGTANGSQDDQGLSGNYIGQSQDFRKIVAVFNTFLSNSNGSQGTAQVTIAGRFELYSNQKDSDGSYSNPYILSFTDGTFDIGSSTIVITVPGDTTPIVFNCELETGKKDTSSLHCTMNGKLYEEFDLSRDTSSDKDPQKP